MKALVLEEIGKLIEKEVPIPQVGNQAVLLKIMAAGICNSDIDRVFKTGTYHFPLIPGHEFSGKIVAVGEEVSNRYLNQRAVVFPLRPCMECFYCKEEEYALCEQYNYFGSRCDGGFAEYLAVPVWNLVLFPERIPYECAAMCEPASVALHGIKRGEIRCGESVLVVGTGTIGLLAVLWLRLLGTQHTVCTVRSTRKEKYLRSVGINEIINLSKESLEKGLERLGLYGQIDAALECAGTPEATINCINGVKKGGRIILYSNPTENVTFPRNEYWKILRKQLSLIGTWNSSYGSRENDWRETVQAMATGRLNVESLITHKFGLGEADSAFRILTEKKELAVKVMFMIGNQKDEQRK